MLRLMPPLMPSRALSLPTGPASSWVCASTALSRALMAGSFSLRVSLLQAVGQQGLLLLQRLHAALQRHRLCGCHGLRGAGNRLAASSRCKSALACSSFCTRCVELFQQLGQLRVGGRTGAPATPRPNAMASAPWFSGEGAAHGLIPSLFAEAHVAEVVFHVKGLEPGAHAGQAVGVAAKVRVLVLADGGRMVYLTWYLPGPNSLMLSP